MRRILELGLVAMTCCAAVARGDDDPRRPPAIETQEVPRVLGGLGISILSTPKGVLSGREAKKENVGGELLAYVW